MTPACSCCPTGAAMATRSGVSAAAQVLGLDGREILPALAEQPDHHWCMACWKVEFAATRHAVAHG